MYFLYHHKSIIQKYRFGRSCGNSCKTDLTVHVDGFAVFLAYIFYQPSNVNYDQSRLGEIISDALVHLFGVILPSIRRCSPLWLVRCHYLQIKEIRSTPWNALSWLVKKETSPMYLVFFFCILIHKIGSVH